MAGIKKFAFINKDVPIEDCVIRKNEIGIIEKESNNIYSVSFVVANKNIQLSKGDFEFLDITKVGDSYGRKICNICHRLLDTTEFSLNQNGKGDRPIRRPSCNECRINIDGVSLLTSERKKWDKIKPHLTPFKCPICEKITIPGLTSKVVLDHNHKNGLARGWICDSCNTGIGRFKDDISILKRAIIFLEE